MGYRSSLDWDDIGILGCLGLIVLIIALAWLEVQIACWLWGIIMVGIFSLPMLTGWQMFGLMVLLHVIMPTSYHHSK